MAMKCTTCEREAHEIYAGYSFCDDCIQLAFEVPDALAWQPIRALVDRASAYSTELTAQKALARALAEYAIEMDRTGDALRAVLAMVAEVKAAVLADRL